MFSSAANPYDELVVKATDENLASEDWALNLEVCDKVSGEGQTGARNAIGALQKRLSHRNPNVQLYALELANTLAQNCGKPLLEELSSRNWTTALDRLVNDRATAHPVKKKALIYIKAWAKQFEDTGDANLGLMGELYDQLRAKNHTFDEPELAPESVEDARQRQEDEELQRVLELSKQDKGGRGAFQPYQPSAPSGSSSQNNYAGGSGSGSASGSGSSKAQPPLPAQSQPSYAQHTYQSQPPALVAEPEPEPVLDLNTATRVRALYTFTSAEVGELNFERGDVIKVLDRGFKEWWRGACNGKIGIFPVTYVEPLAEPSPRELQEEAQEEARVFASLGLVDQLLQTLKGIDPSRGDRLDDRPEIEEMYQASVGLQGQINALIKKYSDQKAELEHMNANFLRAMRQYEDLRNPPAAPIGHGQPPYGYAPQAGPPQDLYAGQYQQHPQQQQQQPSYGRQPSYGAPQQQQPPYDAQSYPAQQQPQPYQPQQQQQQQYMPEPQPAQQLQAHVPSPSQSFPQPKPAKHESAPPQAQQAQQAQTQQAQYYQHQAGSTTSLHTPAGAPNYPPTLPPNQRQNTAPGAAGLGAGSDPQAEHKAAWDAYYRQQAEQQQQQQQGQVPYGQSPYPAAAGGEQAQPPSYGHPQQQLGVDGVVNGVNRLSVG